MCFVVCEFSIPIYSHKLHEFEVFSPIILSSFSSYAFKCTYLELELGAGHAVAVGVVVLHREAVPLPEHGRVGRAVACHASAGARVERVRVVAGGFFTVPHAFLGFSYLRRGHGRQPQELVNEADLGRELVGQRVRSGCAHHVQSARTRRSGGKVEQLGAEEFFRGLGVEGGRHHVTNLGGGGGSREQVRLRRQPRHHELVRSHFPLGPLLFGERGMQQVAEVFERKVLLVLGAERVGDGPKLNKGIKHRSK